MPETQADEIITPLREILTAKRVLRNVLSVELIPSPVRVEAPSQQNVNSNSAAILAMQRVCDHVIHTHAYNASHHQLSQKQLALVDIPCKADIAGGAVGCAGKNGTAEPESLRAYVCLVRMAVLVRWHLNQRTTEEHCMFLANFDVSRTSRNKHGCEARFALPALRGHSRS